MLQGGGTVAFGRDLLQVARGPAYGVDDALDVTGNGRAGNPEPVGDFVTGQAEGQEHGDFAAPLCDLVASHRS